MTTETERVYFRLIKQLSEKREAIELDLEISEINVGKNGEVYLLEICSATENLVHNFLTERVVGLRLTSLFSLSQDD